jgi:putative multiple sugar transport system substrate-binding protein
VRTKKTLAGLVSATLLLALAACGQSDSTSTPPSPGSNKGATIGIAMPTKDSARWIADGDNMVKQFQALGYKTDLQYGDKVVAQQVSQIENMITKGDKLLVIAAIDGSALTDVLAKAKASNIPVISYDRLILGTPNVDYYATFDNFKVGVLQASYIAYHLGLTKGKGPFNIELFAGSSDDNNSAYFFNGAMSVLKPYIDSKKLVVQSGQTSIDQAYTPGWDGAKAQARMDNLLSKSYTTAHVDAVLSPYDGISIGIISSLKGVGYGTPAKPFPIVTGQDAELGSVKSIINGEQTETVYKDTRKLAAVAVQMGNALLTGGKPETNDTTQYNNKVKVVPAFLLQPVAVDKSNYKAALIDSGYYTAAQLG